MKRNVRNVVVYVMITVMLCLQLGYVAVRSDHVEQVQAAGVEKISSPDSAEEAESPLPMVSMAGIGIMPVALSSRIDRVEAVQTASAEDNKLQVASVVPKTTAEEKESLVIFATSIDQKALAEEAAKKLEENPPRITAAELRAEMAEEAAKTPAQLQAEEKARQEVVDKIGVANVEKSLNIRKDSNEDAALVGRLFRGAGAIIKDVDGDWYQITSGKVTGWVMGEYLVTDEAAEKLVTECKPRVATVVTDELCVRKSADDESDIMTTIALDMQFPVSDVSGDWVKIQLTSDVEGYVHSEYVSIADGLYVAMDIEEEEELQDEVDQREADRQAEAEAARQAAKKANSKKNNSNKNNSSSSNKNSSSSNKNNSSSSNKNNGSSSSESSGGRWVSLGTFKITAYCACSKCNGGYAGQTASGAEPTVGYTIAVDRNVIPLGTKVKIDGKDNTYCAQDTGVKGKTIDLFVSSHSAAYDWGVRRREVWIWVED